MRFKVIQVGNSLGVRLPRKRFPDTQKDGEIELFTRDEFMEIDTRRLDTRVREIKSRLDRIISMMNDEVKP